MVSINPSRYSKLFIVEINTITAAENAYINSVVGNDLFADVTFDFSALADYLPGLCGDNYDYVANYITHYVYGVY
ncbi:MAG: hypothetical protein ACETWM_11035 [Candidatus Lokiarchaeia archaeon]